MVALKQKWRLDKMAPSQGQPDKGSANGMDKYNMLWDCWEQMHGHAGGE